MPLSLGLVGVGLALMAVASMLAARKISLPSAIVLVPAGAAAGYLPGVPSITAPPAVIFLGFLPPLVYHAAFFSSPRQLIRNRVPIAFLALGVLAATIGAVAATSHSVAQLTWPQAFALGAVVSPTDPVAATAVMNRMGIRIGLRSILEGESLFNDAFALVALSTAVGAATGAATGLFGVGLGLAWGIVGAVLVGCAVGSLVERVRRVIDEPDIELVISLVTPYAAYLTADRVGTSGVLSAVTVGLWLGWRTAGVFLPRTRLQATTFWNLLVFILNSALFLLIGLELHTVVASIPAGDAPRVMAGAFAVLFVTIAVRVVASLASAALPRRLRLRLPADALHERGWRDRAVIGWSGFRGGVSVAAALSIPEAVGAHGQRSLIVALAFAVVVGTLVIHGSTLPLLIRRIGIESDGPAARVEQRARLAAAEAAIHHLDELRSNTADENRAAIDMLAEEYDARRDRLRLSPEESEADSSHISDHAARALRSEILNAQRQALVRLRNGGQISSEAMRRVIRDLDLEELRLGDEAKRG